MKRQDVYLIIVLIIISVIGIGVVSITSKQGDEVCVYRDGNLIGIYPISSQEEITIEDGNLLNVIIIDNGSVYMKDASCPDKICVRQGNIHNSNQSICCVPNKVVVSITATKEGKYDAITQ